MRTLIIIVLMTLLLASCEEKKQPPITVPKSNDSVTTSQKVPGLDKTNPVTQPKGPSTRVQKPVQYIQPVLPYKLKIGTLPVKNVASAEKWLMPVITWGGDVVTVFGNGGRTTRSGSIFSNFKLQLELYKQDDFVQQVKDYAEGKTPFLRGTLGMINLASEVLTAAGIAPVVIFKETWSTGGDCLVVKGNIKKISDLRGKTIAIQDSGPHLEYLATLLNDAGMQFSDVKLKWLKEMTAPSTASAHIIDPAGAMRADQTIDAAFVISPDAMALTSGGKVGTGAEDSVAGARILLSTKTASRIIADCIAVRPDFLKENRDKIQQMVSAFLRATEEFLLNATAQNNDFKEALKESAQLLFGNTQTESLENVKGLIGDCQMVGFSGNLSFFTDLKSLVNFEKTNDRLQKFLLAEKYLTQEIKVAREAWDYKKLGRFKEVQLKQNFDQKAVQKVLAARQQSRQDESIFEFQISFGPNQASFDANEYRKEFMKVMGFAARYGGSIVQIVGHSDPSKYYKLRQRQMDARTLETVAQSAKNLSLNRANSVRQSILDFSKAKSITLNPSQIATDGKGIYLPLYKQPKNEAEWRANMRVQFRIINVEAEDTTFQK